MAGRKRLRSIIKRAVKKGKYAAAARHYAVTRVNRPLRVKNMVEMGMGFPKKLCVKQRYCEVIQLATAGGGTGALNYYSFSANGMYDPNITGTGHQPMYFDQYGALYDHYCVIGSKISVRFTPTSTAYPCAIVGVFVNDDTTVTPTLFGIMENSLAVHTTVPNTANNNYRLTRKWSAKKFFGKAPLANTELQGTTSGNPTEQSFYTIFIDSSAAAAAASVQAEVTIDYIAVWKELKDIATS